MTHGLHLLLGLRARVLRAVLGLTLTLLASPALADAPVYWAFTQVGSPAQTYRHQTADGACYAAWTAYRQPQVANITPARTYAGTDPTTVAVQQGFSCMEQWSNGANQPPSRGGWANGGWQLWCATNTAPNTSLPTAQQCPTPPPPNTCEGVVRDYQLLTNSTFGANHNIPWTNTPGAVACYNGCQIRSGFTSTAADGSAWAAVSELFATGARCTGASTDPPPAPSPTASAPARPPEGQCPGTINGQSVFVPCSSSSEAPPTPAPTASAPNGTTTTTVSTQCSGGVCTTTTTTRDATGAVISVNGTSQTQSSFCGSNPNSRHCGGNGSGGTDDDDEEESSFGGSCAASFTCSGDAIQCAIAREQHMRNCQIHEKPPGVQATYDALKGEGQATPAFSDSFSLASALPAAPTSGCAVQNFSTTLMPGLTLTVPLGTYLCPHLATIRAVIVAFGTLMWVGIVFVKGD